MSTMKKRNSLPPRSLSASPASVFSVLAKNLTLYFESLSQKISSFAQELHLLVELTESCPEIAGANKFVCVQAREIVERVNQAEMQLLKVVRVCETQALSLELIVTRLLSSVKTCLQDSSDLFFQVQSGLDSEKTFVEEETTKALNRIPGYQGFLIWEDSTVSTSVRRFMEGCTSSQRRKTDSRAEIRFPGGLQTMEFQAVNPPFVKCSISSQQTLCLNIHHVDHLFTSAAISLSNVRNLDQSLLYLKLHLKSIFELLLTCLAQLKIKLQMYTAKKESGDLLRAQLLSDEEMMEKFKKMSRFAVDIGVEGKKIQTHLDKLPEQLNVYARTCIPLDSTQRLQTLLRDSRFKALVVSCGKVQEDIDQLVGAESDIEERVKRRSTGHNDQMKDDSSEVKITDKRFHRRQSYKPEDAPVDILRHWAKLFSRNFQSKTLFRFYHLKSEVLKLYQPHQLAKSLLTCRTALEEDLLGVSTKRPKEWVQKVTALTSKIIHLDTFQAKVTLSGAVSGLHSYKSSWDLDTGSRSASPEARSDDSYSISSGKGTEEWNESELSCSVQSISELVADDVQDQSRRFLFKELKGVYYPLDQIPDQLNFLRNSLNKQTKKLYEQGVNGWKKDLKTLNAKERDVQKASNWGEDELWQETKSPIHDTARKKSPGSKPDSSPMRAKSTTVRRTIVRDATFQNPSVPALKRRFILKSKGSSVQHQTQVSDLISAKSTEAALMKLSRSKNLTQIVKSCAKSEKFEKELVDDLNRLAPKIDTGIGRQMSATAHPTTQYLKHRIALIQRDRSQSPFEKIKNVREEFKRYYDTMTRPKSANRLRFLH